jgi:hypothetical protein
MIYIVIYRVQVTQKNFFLLVSGGQGGVSIVVRIK